MNIQIRREEKCDYDKVKALVFLAFKNMEFADGDEHELVENLRKSKNYVHELSLVALVDGIITGHIMFSTCNIISDNETIESLTLAPVSVDPDFQKRGIGGMLIREGLRIAESMGFLHVNLFGHPAYYPRFGFESASKYGINPPMEAPEGVFMIIELKKNSLKGVTGVVQYAKEFGI